MIYIIEFDILNEEKYFMEFSNGPFAYDYFLDLIQIEPPHNIIAATIGRWSNLDDCVWLIDQYHR